MLGDPGVGKTSLVRRFVENYFSDKYIHTIGTKVSKKVIDYPEMDTCLTFLIWDIVGQKSMAFLTSYYRGASGALVVCDLTRDSTLESVPDWIGRMREKAGDIPFIIIANKCDLTDRIMFDEDTLAIMSRRFNAPYYTTSAKTGENVEETFRKMGNLVLSH